MRNRIVAGAAGLGLGAALALSACAGHSLSSSSADKAAASAAARDLEPVAKKCGVTSVAGQLAAVKDVTEGTDGIERLLAKCGVPKDQYKAVENQVLQAAEQGHLVKGGHAARVTFFTVTFPHIILVSTETTPAAKKSPAKS